MLFKIRNIMRDNYDRNLNIPSAGFAAGPCLLKDTMQLSSFYNHNFSLGKSAMSINDNLPKFFLLGFIFFDKNKSLKFFKTS